MILLNREFLTILIIAGVLGAASGYYLTDYLLRMIYPAYHVQIEMTTLVLCAFSVLFIGIMTTTVTIYRAARANPVDALRDE
jgi:ABC-type antimicrobial peptide transport system permease subunit